MSSFAITLVTLFVMAAPASAFARTLSVGPENCNEPSGPVTVDDSPNKSYFEQILNKGSRVQLADLIKFWYPGRKAETQMHWSFEDCIEDHTRCDGPFPIDTVYSWGPLVKLRTLQKTMPDGEVWSGQPNPGRQLQALVSAIGSYGYGIIPVRIKLKPTSVARWLSVHLDSDFSVMDGEDVESWSFATPEHYDEIIRDYLRYRSGKPWIGYSASSETEFGQEQLFFSGLDGHDFTENVLKESLLTMIRMILNGEGRINYPQGQCRNRKSAFQTQYPTYINW